MNKRIKQLWIDTLRSDTVKQGTGRLCKLRDNEYEFCCLGVLCEIYQSEASNSENNLQPLQVNENNMGYYDKHFSYDTNFGILPDKVKYWSELGNSLGSYYENNRLHSDLASQNDSGKSFKEIADIIEKHF